MNSILTLVDCISKSLAVLPLSWGENHKQCKLPKLTLTFNHLNSHSLNEVTYTACRVFESPYDCVHQATYWFYDYFGFNVSYACRGAENVTAQIESDWTEIISLFCGDNVPQASQTLEDVCPTPDRSKPPPEGQTII